jgi:hypothetical protein
VAAVAALVLLLLVLPELEALVAAAMGVKQVTVLTEL